MCIIITIIMSISFAHYDGSQIQQLYTCICLYMSENLKTEVKRKEDHLAREYAEYTFQTPYIIHYFSYMLMKGSSPYFPDTSPVHHFSYMSRTASSTYFPDTITYINTISATYPHHLSSRHHFSDTSPIHSFSYMFMKACRIARPHTLLLLY